MKAAREELALGLAIKQVDALGLSGSANADQIIANAFQEQLKALDDLGGSQDEYIAGLQHRVRELGKADKETVALTKTVAESGRAIERASEAAAKFPGPAAHIRTVGDAFGGAKREAENLGDAVEGGGKKTETAVERMAAHIRTVPAEWRNAGTAATDAASATTAAADATAASIRKVPVALTEAGTGATAALEPVSVALDGMAAKSAEVATGLPGQFDSAATEIADAFASAFGRVRSDLDALVSAVTAAISRMSAALAALKSEIASTKAAASSAGSSGSGSSGGGGSGFWRGGQVHGPGTSTSDSIFARLSRGEFVIRAAAVEKFGPQFFAALNSLRLPKDMLKGFNMGGMVDGWNSSMSSLMPVPAFNHGGEVGASSGGRPVTLVLPNGERVEGMTATSDAVDQFMRHVRTKAHRAAGKSPGWVR